MNLDRLITTDMSANIVAALIKQGWSASEIAQTIDAPQAFVIGVQKRKQVLTLRDVRVLAKRSGQTPQLMLLDSIKSIRPEAKELFEATRRLLQKSASPAPGSNFQRRANGKRRTRKTAA